MTRFLVVPQWQGSPSARAMRLAEGAAAIRGDLPGRATTEIAVPLEAGDDQDTGIARFTALQLVRERMTDELSELPGPVVVVGGDCGVSDAAMAAAARDGSPLAVVWFDAHPDLNSPATSPSGAYAGMVLRAAIDDGRVPAARAFLVGARSWDPGEEAYAAEQGIRSFPADGIADPAPLVDAVAASGAERVYLHIDLDVLDPAAFRSLLDPEPFGVAPGDLIGALRALLARFPLAGATIASYAPATQDDAVEDAPTVLRIIGALNSAAPAAWPARDP